MILPFSYTLTHHPRAKHMSIRITRVGEVVVTKPKNIRMEIIEDFVQRKSDWVMQKLAYVATLPKPAFKMTRVEMQTLKEKALSVLETRVKYFNQFYNFTYNHICIKNQKTRWGSCSSKKNLNFNVRLITLEPELLDYVVVHELCHLQEMNHGPKFWSLIQKVMPEYKMYHAKLRKIGLGNID